MELVAYLDRSRLDSPYAVEAVGGALSSQSGWEAALERWNSVLARAGLTSFHMTDFETRQPGYSHLTKAARQETIAGLTEAISEHCLVAFSSGMDLGGYERVKAEMSLDLPYVMCGVGAVAEVADWLKEAPSEEPYRALQGATVRFVFEEGDQGAARLQELLTDPAALGTYKGRVVAAGFESKSENRRFEIADFVAYETTKQLVRTLGYEARPMRESLRLLAGKTPYIGRIQSEASLREFVARMLAE